MLNLSFQEGSDVEILDEVDGECSKTPVLNKGNQIK